MAGVKITYETLFDLLRREKSRNDLQELEGTFFLDVLTYLKEKKATLNNSNDSKLFSSAENEKIKIQLKNINKILDELYEIRQKKIMNMAIHKSKTNSNLIDTSKMLPEEHSLFLEIYTLLSKFKRNILGNLLKDKLPAVAQIRLEKQILSSEQETKETKPETEQTQNIENTNKNSEQQIGSQDVKIKFLANLPKFMGLDKKIYGPYKVNEISEVPNDLAQMLIKKGRAQTLES